MKNTPCGHAENVEGCGYCHLFHNVPVYQAKWSGAKPANQISKAVRKRMCRWLGEATGKQVVCAEGCRKGNPKAVYACAKFGECTIAERGVGVVGCCNGKCPEFQLPEKVIEPTQQGGIAGC